MAQVLFGLFGLSFLTSKSAFTLFYAVAVLFGIYKYDWKNLAQKSILEKIMISLYPVAILTNLFSLGGWSDGALTVLLRWTWPLIFFPVVFLQKNEREKMVFFKGLAIGLFVACCYSLYLFTTRFNFTYDSDSRVASFWDISRWGYFCALAIICLFHILLKNQKLNLFERKFAFGLFLLSFFCLLINNSRAAWFAALIGIFLLLIMHRKSFKFYLTYILVLGVLLALNPEGRERVLSAFSIHQNEGRITSKNSSNAGRLNMWKVTLDFYQEVPFFGVGFENSRWPLKNFLSRQNQDYVQTYTTVEYSYNDQHSSYLTVLLQFGGIFFVYLFMFTIVVALKFRKSRLYFPLLICILQVFVFYSSLVSYEAVTFFGVLSFLITQPQDLTQVS